MTKQQLGILRHALGLDRAKSSYRNRYCADLDNEDCRQLVADGLMEQVPHGVPTGGLVTYRVTVAGRAAALGENGGDGHGV